MPLCAAYIMTGLHMADLSEHAIQLVQQGDLDGARALFQFALDQRTAVFGADSPAIATDLANLGNVLADLHDVAAARPLLERAVALREQQCGPEHPDLATELGNLGLLLEEAGDLPAARTAYERALAIQLAASGDFHPNVGIALSNLAGTSLRPPGMCWHGPLAGAHENFGYWGDCKKRPENESANGARAQASEGDRLNAQRR